MSEHNTSQPKKGQPPAVQTGSLAPRTGQLPQTQPPRLLPPWRVILHNDDKNEIEDVVRVVRRLTPLNQEESIARTLEAHKTGVSVLLVTHQERAELYVEQFQSCGLTVTAEADA